MNLEQALATIDSALAQMNTNRDGHVTLQTAMTIVRAAIAAKQPPVDTDEPITGTVEPEG